jgi:acetyl-CoA carboxylase biotin carboxyl carrier protein
MSSSGARFGGDYDAGSGARSCNERSQSQLTGMDIEQIKSLVELMVAHDLSRIELREGDTHVLLRRGQTPAPGAAGPIAPTSPAPSAVASSPEASRAPAVTLTGAVDTEEHLIRSPMVGTFYASADPESPPFVRVGDVVQPETVVCVVEAMKVFNEIKAESSGRVMRVLVKNAEAVEFDQPLFALAPG